MSLMEGSYTFLSRIKSVEQRLLHTAGICNGGGGLWSDLPEFPSTIFMNILNLSQRKSEGKHQVHKKFICLTEIEKLA